MSIDWSDPATNDTPFVTCPACEGVVVQVTSEPLTKTCTGCEKTYVINTPLKFRLAGHNAADAIAYQLNDAGLPWPSVSIVMRIYHNIEINGGGWRWRIKRRYPRAQTG